MSYCINKNTELYKALLNLNGNNDGAAYQQASYITSLQNVMLLSKNRFNPASGKLEFTIPKTISEKSIANSFTGKSPYDKNNSAYNELDKSITLDNIDWIKLRETENAFIATILPLNNQLALFQTDNNIDYAFKVINNIQKNINKVNSWFKQLGNTDKFWSKIQQDLQIPKEQIELLKDSKGNTIEEKLASFAANYSYTVEINIAKQKRGEYDETDLDNFDPEYRQQNTSTGNENSKYYFNLTVPGGTNYTENEIATPTITPSIKGHAQFATDNGIGWFRSDEQAKDKLAAKQRLLDIERGYGGEDVYQAEGSKTRRILEIQSDLFQKGRDKDNLTTIEKLSDYNYTTAESFEEVAELEKEGWEREGTSEDGMPFYKKAKTELEKRKDKEKAESPNQFLQLLNKDNNWVTFFIKSIIQDSAKKGYEKVLFPSGDTASKVEGHDTLEHFKSEKKLRIKYLEQELKDEKRLAKIKAIKSKKKEYFRSDVSTAISNEDFEKFKNLFGYKIDDEGDMIIINPSPEKVEEILGYKNPSNILIKYEALYNASYIYLEYDQEIDNTESFIRSDESIINEINRFKQELERVETEGFGALKPIYNFYENVVTNILKKQGYSPTVITDEYGNTWNEINIKPIYTNNILFQTKTEGELTNDIWNGLEDFIKNNNINIKFYESLKSKYSNDPIAAFNLVNKVIEINQNKVKNDTLPEELSHYLVEALGENHTLVKRSLNLINKYGISKVLGSEYEQYNQLYAGNQTLLVKEALGKLIAKSIVKKPNIESTEIGNSLIDTIKKLIDKFISLFTPNDNIMKQIEKNVNELSKIMKSGEKLPDIKSINAVLYQIDNDLKHKKQYQHFINKAEDIKTLIKKLKIKYNHTTNPLIKAKLKKDILTYQSELQDINKALVEVNSTGNRQLLVNLANKSLDRISNYIKDVKSGEKQFTDETIAKQLEILNLFSGLTETATTAQKLQEEINFLVAREVDNMQREAVNKGLNESDDNNIEEDISNFEFKFGSLANVTNYIAKTIGFFIKKTQSIINDLNNKAFKEVSDAVKSLENYVTKKGISKDKMYDIFIQQHNGTLVLTRPYTSEFYDLINSSFDTNRYSIVEGKRIRNSIALFDNDSLDEKWIPKDLNKYGNKNYSIIMKEPELKKFYDFFKNKIFELSEKLPISLRHDFIPNLINESLLDILKSDKNLTSKLKNGISHLTDITIDQKPNIDFNNLKSDKLPLKYIMNVSADKKSKNLGESLLQFTYFVNSYEQMTNVLPRLRMLQNILGKKEFKKHNKNTIIEGTETDLYKMTDKVIEMQVLGKMKNEESIKGFQYSKLIDFMMRYTSLLRIGLRPDNAFTNVAIGRIGNRLEASGGRFFNRKELISAEAMFFNNLGKKDSKFHKMLETINPLRELEDYANLEKLGKGLTNKDKITSAFYAPQKYGEYFLQSTTMVASMKHDKIADKNGNMISLWDAFNKDGQWDVEKMGRNLEENELFRIKDKIYAINEMIHGRYSAQDAAVITQNVWMRALFQFRKWMPAAIEQRFGQKRFDERLGIEMEGRWRTWVKSLKFVIAQLQNDQEKLESLQFTETDKYNMQKNYRELLLVVSMTLTGLLLAGAGDDDKELKKEAWYKFTLDQCDRIAGDLTFFANIKEMNATLMNSAALLKTNKDLLDVFLNINHAFSNDPDDMYRKGPKKGENKFYSNLGETIPGYSAGLKFYRYFNNSPYEDVSK